MELICRIIEQHDLVERDYTTADGNVQRFASMGFVLASGGEAYYCEMVQEQARRQGRLPQNCYYKASVAAVVRPWVDQQQRKHWENHLKLTKIEAL